MKYVYWNECSPEYRLNPKNILWVKVTGQASGTDYYSPASEYPFTPERDKRPPGWGVWTPVDVLLDSEEFIIDWKPKLEVAAVIGGMSSLKESITKNFLEYHIPFLDPFDYNDETCPHVGACMCSAWYEQVEHLVWYIDWIFIQRLSGLEFELENVKRRYRDYKVMVLGRLYSIIKADANAK